MKSTGKLTLSVCLVSLTLGAGANAQGLGNGGDAGAVPAQLIPMDQLKQLQEWMQLCSEGRPLPGERDCAAVERVLEQPDLIGTLGLFDAEPVADPDPQAGAVAPEPEAQQPDATAVAPDPEPEAQQPDATAVAPDPEPEAQEPDATVEAPDPEPEAQQPDATAVAPDPEPEAQQPDATVAAPDPEPEAQQPDATAVAPDPEPQAQQPDVTAVAPDPEPEAQQPDATAVAPDPEPEAQEPDGTAVIADPDPQAQADAVERMEQNAPVAAAGADRDDGDVTSEVVTTEDVRRSDQDFTTDVARTEEPKAKKAKDDGDDDNDRAKRLAGVALLGLGAVALAEILDQNDRVVTNSGDRVVVERDGQFRVLRNDDVLLRRPGAEVQTQRFEDGSTRNILTYQDGTVVETILAADGRVVRRVRILPDGQEVVLFDDTQPRDEVVISDLPEPRQDDRINYRDAEVDALARALAAQEAGGIDRRFSLAQVRNIDAVRKLVPVISVDSINFETGSAAIRVEEAEELAALGNVMRDAIARNPGEVFLIEGHTDAVGSYALNLALSDRRAESVALALTEYFDVPPENMVLQGYGEGDLLIRTDTAERANRRAAVRRITPLLQ
ncbi:OmpA family protein [Antarctobacter jejuensis]|uniref:OmpA family protein n=1 Tax=Antarctobacter jejuensis TaxID=1439938 RepID=UPI003FD1B259